MPGVKQANSILYRDSPVVQGIFSVEISSASPISALGHSKSCRCSRAGNDGVDTGARGAMNLYPTPLKMDGWKMNFLFGMAYFQGLCQFQAG